MAFTGNPPTGERIFSGNKRTLKCALTGSLLTPDGNFLSRDNFGIPTRPKDKRPRNLSRYRIITSPVVDNQDKVWTEGQEQNVEHLFVFVFVFQGIQKSDLEPLTEKHLIPDHFIPPAGDALGIKPDLKEEE